MVFEPKHEVPLVMDMPDIEVPDTIPDYIARRHQRGARRTVTRAAEPFPLGLSTRGLQTLLWITVVMGLVGITTGVVMLWMTYPSPATFVAIPTVLLVFVYAAGVFAYRNRESLL